MLEKNLNEYEKTGNEEKLSSAFHIACADCQEITTLLKWADSFTVTHLTKEAKRTDK